MKYTIKRSLAGKISACVIALITLIFCVIMVLFYQIAEEKIITSSMRHAKEMLATMSVQIDAQLQTVSHSVQLTAWVVENNIHCPDSIGNVLKHNVLNNKLIIGSALAFVPKEVNGKEELTMFYVSRNKDGIKNEKINCDNYYYPDMDWFKTALQIKQGYWSEPYFDKGVGNVMMTTYSLPLINSLGEVYAVYTADISLLHFTGIVKKEQLFADGYSFLLSRKGYYLTHQKPERILHETVFSIAKKESNTDYEEIGRAMVHGETGYKAFDNDGYTPSYAVYTPVSNIGWSICNVGKQETLLIELNKITHLILIIFLIGIMTFFSFSILIIKRLMKPLEGFATSAQKIAHGDFQACLPNIQSEVEMKKLHDSFVYMQKSLSAYTSELKETTATKERIQSELHIAHEIQMGMIPKIFPPFPEREDVDLHAILKPAKEVGGDLYDFFISNEKLYFAIGDVSGKGIPASLFMAVTRSLFRNISGYIFSPQEIVTRMNDSISEQNESNMFITLFVGILDLKNGKLTYCNAGHNPPVIVSPTGQASFMKIKQNLPVGLMADFEYIGEEVVIERGVKLFCYTDGVVEAENEQKELYSESRLLQTLSACYQQNVRQITEYVLESVANHVLIAEPSDDLTILVMNFK